MRDIRIRTLHDCHVPPSADRYAQMRAVSRVRERALFLPLRTPSELELQAGWFAGEFGRSFVSTRGNHIDIVQFGTWNREAGPDFSDAAVSVNRGEPIPGCVEIDLVDRNWELHGHATNPVFDQTVLHVFVDKSEREFFTRTISNRNVPQVRIDPATLPEAFSANIPLARPGRCQAPLKNLPEDHIRSVLDAAAQFRLQKKAARIRAKIDNQGRHEALFQEIGAALGYKEIAVHAHRATGFVGVAARQRERRRSDSFWSRRLSGNTRPRRLQKGREELCAPIVGLLVAAP